MELMEDKMELSDVYKKIKTSYETQTGETISDDGDFGMRMQVVAGEMAGLYQQADFVLQQMLPQTATGTYLERHAAIRGIERKQGIGCGGHGDFFRLTEPPHRMWKFRKGRCAPLLWETALFMRRPRRLSCRRGKRRWMHRLPRR